MEFRSEVIKKGNYKMEDTSVHSVYILKQNWDYFYEEGYDEDEPDLDEDGFAYYALYGEFEDLLNANRSRTCISEQEAINLAEEVLSSKIEWENIVFKEPPSGSC